MQAIGGSVREWRGRRELRHRKDDVFRPAESLYFSPAVPAAVGDFGSLSATPVAVMVPAPKITGYGRARRRTALAVAAIVAAAAIPAFAITSIFTRSSGDDGVMTASTDAGTGSTKPAAPTLPQRTQAVTDPAAPAVAAPVNSAPKPHPATVAAAPTTEHRVTKPTASTAANATEKQQVAAGELAQLPRNEKPISMTPVTEKPSRPLRIHHTRPAHRNSEPTAPGSKAAPATGTHPAGPAVGVGAQPVATHPDNKPVEAVPSGQHPVAPVAQPVEPKAPQAPAQPAPAPQAPTAPAPAPAAPAAPAPAKPAAPEAPGSTAKVDPASRNATAPAAQSTADDPAAAPAASGAKAPQSAPAQSPTAKS